MLHHVCAGAHGQTSLTEVISVRYGIRKYGKFFLTATRTSTVNMPIKHVLEDFANQTTMHGVPKVIQAKSIVSRLFWTVICIAAGSMFCMQMSEVLRRYFSYNKKVTVEVVPTPVPFPSISLCNMRNLDFYTLNALNRKFLANEDPATHMNTTDSAFIREYMRIVAPFGALFHLPEYQTKYAVVFQEIFSRTTFSSNIPEDIIAEAAVQLEEFVVNCYFAGTPCNRTQEFVRFFDPYYFNCFTYTNPSSKDGEIFSLSEGIENGWSSVILTGSGMLDNNSEIRIVPGLHESQSAVAASEGIRVVIHPPGTKPFPFTEGYDVPPGFSASFGIRPLRNLRIGPPHGNCTDTNPFDVESKETTHYRGISCQKMCLQSHVIEKCGCHDASLPSLPHMNVSSCRKSDIVPDSCIKNATEECLQVLLKLHRKIECARNTRNLVNRNTTLMQACQCYPPCDEVQFDVSYSLSKWPASGYEGDAAYHDVFFIQYFKERFRDTPKFEDVDEYFSRAENESSSAREQTMKNFARLNVYVADSNVMKTQEGRDYELTQLVSDIGGQLGLWVGISVITLTEVLELVGEVCRYLFSANMAQKGKTKSRRATLPIPAGSRCGENGSYRRPVEGFTYAEQDSYEGMLGCKYPDTFTSFER